MRLRPDKKTQRQVEAVRRVQKWRTLTPQQQLESLSKRRGTSTRQVNKLLEKVEVQP